jgi:SAM-dependent methyltransferase
VIEFASLLERLAPVCPDDATPLSPHDGGLACPLCSRVFQILAGRVIDLSPARPATGSWMTESYATAYREMFAEPLTLEAGLAPWADPTRLTASEVERKRAHVEWIYERVARRKPPPSERILCDIAGGPGYYTLGLAHRFRAVIHCDLSARALSSTYNRASAAGLTNVYFLRLDYLALPFRGTLDVAICLDTLIRGPDHDELAYRRIAAALSPSGVGFVDFHNWWHNPLRRLGLLPDNFVDNRSYTRREVERIARSPAGVVSNLFPFYSEIKGNGLAARAARFALPATRHTVEIETVDADGLMFEASVTSAGS